MGASDAARPAGLPRPGLFVAVTGHRPHRLALAHRERIAAQAGAVLAQLAALAAERAAPCWLISALAEGADRQLAALALDGGYALHALLPFGRADYLQDFAAAGSRLEFERLLGRAARVTELPGVRADAEAAYQAAGHALLDAADLLCALWDGAPGQGPGGTGEVVAEALRRGLPVLHLSAGGAPPQLLSAGQPPRPCDAGALRGLLPQRAAGAKPAVHATLLDRETS